MKVSAIHEVARHSAEEGDPRFERRIRVRRRTAGVSLVVALAVLAMAVIRTTAEDRRIAALLEDLGANDGRTAAAAVEELSRTSDPRHVKRIVKHYGTIEARTDAAFVNTTEVLVGIGRPALDELVDAVITSGQGYSFASYCATQKTAVSQAGVTDALAGMAPESCDALLTQRALYNFVNGAAVIDAFLKMNTPQSIRAALQVWGSLDAKGLYVDGPLEIMRRGWGIHGVVIAAFETAPASERLDALRALCLMRHPKSVGLLLSLTESDDPVIAAQAARGLGYAGGTEAAGRCLELLGHESPDVRAAAASAFTFIKDARAIDPLIALQTDKDTSVRAAAVLALEAQEEPDAQAAVETIVAQTDLRLLADNYRSTATPGAGPPFGYGNARGQGTFVDYSTGTGVAGAISGAPAAPNELLLVALERYGDAAVAANIAADKSLNLAAACEDWALRHAALEDFLRLRNIGTAWLAAPGTVAPGGGPRGGAVRPAAGPGVALQATDAQDR